MNVQTSFWGRTLRRSGWRAVGLALILGQSAAPLAHAAGTVVGWGANDAGQAVVPQGLSNVVAVAGGVSHSLALKGNGSVVAWGYNISGQATVPPSATNVIAIGGGVAYSLALRNNGTLLSWGDLAGTPAGLSNVTAIAAGWYHALALRANGTVVSWGSQTNVPAGLTNVVAIAAGNGQSLALRSDGTVVAWGDNAFGKATVPSGLSGVKAIAAGADHCLALLRDGSVVAWGSDANGQGSVPSGLGTVIEVSAGALHSVALRADGTIVAWGDSTYNQTNINQTVTGFVDLAAGGYHSLAIKGDNFPFILLQPVSQNVFITKSATLQVTAAGAQPLTYQWRHYGTNLPGATNSILVLQNFQVSDGGPYDAYVANAYGSAISQEALLTPVGGPPILVMPLQDQTVPCGDTAVFEALVDGSGPFDYQWRFEGNSLPGATTSSLVLTNVLPTQAGFYSVSVTNAFGNLTTGAVLTVAIEAPQITSTLVASGKQGEPFTYTMTALHNPLSFNAIYLPRGLTVDTNTGVISGIPEQQGVFGVLLSAYNACSADSRTLVLTVASSAPAITSASSVLATEGQPMAVYQVTATESPTSFGALNLPVGILIDPVSGQISGTPVYAGTFNSTIIASNQWGFGTAPLEFRINNAVVFGLSIDNRTFSYSYQAPHLLDFKFTLRDNNDPDLGSGLVTKASSLTATCMENWPVGPNPRLLAEWPELPNATELETNYIAETGVFISRGSGKVLKTYLVLDYTDSISDPVVNGDNNQNLISDAVDYMVQGAQYFVNQQPVGAQLGVYEFHRDDLEPQKVIGLTRNKQLLSGTIDGIWTNYVNWWYAGSRCWDAVDAAIQALGAPSPDEQHYVVVVSDGLDSSSVLTVETLIGNASAAGVQIYCIAFGTNPDLATLRRITTASKGRLYVAQTPADLFQQFALVSKDIQAQYVLRWATLRRDTSADGTFAPYFLISYQGHSAAPTNWWWFYYTNTWISLIDTNADPGITNYTTNTLVLWTNTVIGPYNPGGYIGPVTNGGFAGPLDESGGYIAPVTTGLLRLVADEEVEPSGLTLRSTYAPRYVRQLRIHYRPNWPCTPILNATNSGEMLEGWSVTETNDVDGSKWLLLNSPNPQDPRSSLPFASFGPLITFKFNDAFTNFSSAFSLMEVDNAIYTNVIAGGQSFVFVEGNLDQFVKDAPILPFGTPPPWLIAYGLAPASATSNVLAEAEITDADNDGVLNWQEYRANTDPNDPASKLVIRSVTRQADGRFEVLFSSAINRRYRVEASVDLFTWQTVQDNVAGTGADLAVIDTNFYPGANSLYYRILVY